MNHHLVKTYRKRRAVAVVVIIGIVLFFLLQKGLLKSLNPILAKIFAPIWQAENFTVDYLSININSKADLWRQNTLLKEKLERQEADLLQLESLKEENKIIKEILGRVNPDSNIVLASILVKPNTTPYDVLIIDRGEKDGLKPDDLVFGDGDILLGEVESVEKDISRVLMYSTPGNISQVILGNTGIYFNAHGLGNGTFEVQVSREANVNIGDNFFYPGLDNVLVGVAKKIDFDPRDSFKSVIMKSPINIQEERWVEVRI